MAKTVNDLLPKCTAVARDAADLRRPRRRSRRRGSLTSRMILKSMFYKFHRLDLTRQAGFIVTVYDEDGLRLAGTMPCATPAAAFAEGRKIVDGKVEGPRK